MRILVTVQPQMYREALALALHDYRPDAEVLLGQLKFLNGKAEDFRPHLLVRNDTDEADTELWENVLCWVEILYSDGMDARVRIDGEVQEIEDISMQDLLAIVERAERLIG